MKKKIITSILIFNFILFGLASYSASQTQPTKTTTATVQQPAVVYTNVQPLEVVKSPAKYLNKNIRMKATFDKFTNLGLDYKPAMRSTQNYITFLILRDDAGSNIIPLSEMKLFLTRKKAEKFIELETGDKIQIEGKVFSNALSDTWIDVHQITIISKKNPKKA